MSVSSHRLFALAEGLAGAEAEAFHSLFRATVTKSAPMVLPPAFVPKIQRWFNPDGRREPADVVAEVCEQKCVKVVDLWTRHQCVYNPIKVSKPKHVASTAVPADADDNGMLDGCDFCAPADNTAEESWGRIEGRHTRTASNVVKYDAVHGMIVFKEHSPLRFSRAVLEDMVDVARQYYARAQAARPDAVFPLLAWNALPRAGASQHHGHCHVLLLDTLHCAGAEQLYAAAAAYERAHPGHDYFAAFIAAHRGLGLALSVGSATIVVALCPHYHHEVFVLAPEPTADFVTALAHVVESFLAFGMVARNVAVYFRPNDVPGAVAGPATRAASTRPVIARVCDRGDPATPVSDLCATQLLAFALCRHDPFALAAALFADRPGAHGAFAAPAEGLDTDAT